MAEQQSQFEVGDIVTLKTGGITMTVTGAETNDRGPRVWCSWSEPNEHGQMVMRHCEWPAGVLIPGVVTDG